MNRYYLPIIGVVVDFGYQFEVGVIETEAGVEIVVGFMIEIEFEVEIGVEVEIEE